MVLKQCRSGGKRTPLHSQALGSSHAPLHTQGSENPQLSILFQPLPGEEKGDPDLPAKIWGGAEGTPQNVLLRNLEAKRMGEGPGAGISDPPPWALGGLQEAPLSQPAIWPQGCGESRGRGMGTVTTGSLKFPRLAAGKLKCAPMGVEWGGALPPTPQSLTFGLRVCCLFLNLHAPLEQMGELVPMDGADDVEHCGLTEDLGKWGRPQHSDLSLVSSLMFSKSHHTPHSIPHRVVQKMPAGGPSQACEQGAAMEVMPP